MEPQSALEEEIEHLLARAEAADITREEREQLIERLRQSIKQFRQDKGVPATNFWRRLLKISQEAGNNTAGGITPLQAEEPQFHHNDKQLPQLSSDEELFFFSVARQQLETNQRFQIERELQTGQYSTGFIAVDNFTHSRVVLKLPAKGRWSERFDICAEALQAEMTLLPAAQNLVPDSDPEIAELVKHVADGTLTVENWPRPIPWLAQAFARGRRVSDAGLLPEPVVLRILLQVIGLVVKLAAQVPPIAHRDLKADCLFWDEEREKVEVIDWNRATTNPTEQDRKLEFEAIRRLTQELLLGSQFTWSSPDAISDDLFISGRARHLSRGARLLLLRLFAPMPNNAIRDVATLQLVLRHLVLAWSTPFVEGFLSTTELGAKRSDLLDRMDIELRRRQVSQPENIHFSALYKEFIERTQKDIQSRLNTWLTIPTALRAGYRDIVDVWQWLPDMWPLQYLVPLVGLWFSAHPKDQDAELINLVRVMSSSKWDDLSQYSFKPNLEASSLLKIRRQQINEVARAYQNLQKLESAITNSNPDYMDLGRQLQSLADKIPLEAKIIQIQGIISAGLKRQEDIGRLLDKEKTLREQAPTSLLQEELLEVATQLHNLHYTDSDPRRANQQKIVDEIRNAKARLTEAQHSLSSANDWSSVLENVGPLKENPSLSQYAPDLIDELNIIYDKAIDLRRQYLRGMLSSSKDEVKALIDQGQFSDASKRALQAVNTTEQANDPLLSKELDEAWLQCRFATALERAWDQLISGNKRQAHDGLKTLKADNPLVNDLFLICDFTIQAESADSGIGVVEVLKKIVSHKAKTSQGPAIVEEQWDKLKMSVAETAAQKLRDDIASLEDPSYETIKEYRENITHLESFIPSDPLAIHYATFRLRSVEDLSKLGEKLRTLETKLSEKLRSLETQLEEFRTVESRLREKLQTVESGLREKLRTLETQLEEFRTVESRLREKLQTLETQLEEKMVWGQRITALEDKNGSLESKLQNVTSELEKVRELFPPVATASDTSKTNLMSADRTEKSLDVGKPLLDIQAEQKPKLRAYLPVWASVGLGAMLLIAVVTGGFFFFNRGEGKSGQATVQPVMIAMVTETSVLVTPTTQPSIMPSPTAFTPTPTSQVVQTVELNEAEGAYLPGARVVLTSPFRIETDQVSLVVGTQKLTLDLNFIEDSTQFTLPSDIYRQLAEFTLPQEAQLDLGTNYLAPTISLAPVEVSVLGVDLEDGSLLEQQHIVLGQLNGAYLWHAPNEHDELEQDAVKPKGVTTRGNFVILRNDDRVKILGGNEQYYQIEVVTNTIDKNNPNVVGQQGWVLRQIIDGPQS